MSKKPKSREQMDWANREYSVPGNSRKHLVVSPKLHEAVNIFACSRRMTIVEATFKAINIGLEIMMKKIPPAKPIPPRGKRL